MYNNISKFTAGAAVVLLLAASSCGTSSILRADFEQFDVIPNAQPQSIPGQPEGDQIDNLDAALEVENVPIAGEFLRINGSADFIVASHEQPTEYQVTIQGAFASSLPGQFRVTVLDEDDNRAFVLQRVLDQVRVLSGDGDILTNFDLQPGVLLTLNVTIRGGATHNLDFVLERPGQEDQVVNELEKLDNDFETVHRVRIEGASAAPFYANGVYVYHRE